MIPLSNADPECESEPLGRLCSDAGSLFKLRDGAVNDSHRSRELLLLNMCSQALFPKSDTGCHVGDDIPPRGRATVFLAIKLSSCSTLACHL